jgi:hypothetical protein
MTTRPSNQTHDKWSAATMAAYIPQTVSMRAAAEFDPAAPMAARQAYMTDLAWSAEPPEYASPLPIERRRRWFTRSAVLIFVGGGLVAAAAAGLFGALHGGHSAPVDMTNHSAPPAAPVAAPPAAPAAAAANPAPTPGNQTWPATTSHSVTASHKPCRSISTQAPSQYSTPPSSGQHTTDQQWQSNHSSVSTPPTWNRNDFFYLLTHRHNHGSPWTGDRDSGNHSTGSDDNGSSN